MFQELAQTIEGHLERRMAEWRVERPGVAELKVAVMGCIVNGPGESRAADIGISLPGTGEQPRAPVYVDGEKATTLEGPTLADDFIRMVEDYVEARFPRAGAEAVPPPDRPRGLGREARGWPAAGCSTSDAHVKGLMLCRILVLQCGSRPGPWTCRSLAAAGHEVVAAHDGRSGGATGISRAAGRSAAQPVAPGRPRRLRGLARSATVREGGIDVVVPVDRGHHEPASPTALRRPGGRRAGTGPGHAPCTGALCAQGRAGGDRRRWPGSPCPGGVVVARRLNGDAAARRRRAW